MLIFLSLAASATEPLWLVSYCTSGQPLPSSKCHFPVDLCNNGTAASVAERHLSCRCSSEIDGVMAHIRQTLITYPFCCREAAQFQHLQSPQQYAVWHVEGLGLVVAFRGTSSWDDVFVDINVRPTPLISDQGAHCWLLNTVLAQRGYGIICAKATGLCGGPPSPHFPDHHQDHERRDFVRCSSLLNIVYEPAVHAQVSLQTPVYTPASGKEQSNMLRTSSKLCSSKTGRRTVVCLSGSQGTPLGVVMPTA